MHSNLNGHMIVNGLDLWWKAKSSKVRGNKGEIGKEQQQNTTSTLTRTVPHVGDSNLGFRELIHLFPRSG